MKRSLRRVDHLRGSFHGSDERRYPDRLVVPVIPTDLDRRRTLPRYTREEADDLGLIDAEELAELFGWSKSKIRYRRNFAIPGTSIEPVGILRGDTGNTHLFRYTDVEALEKK